MFKLLLAYFAIITAASAIFLTDEGSLIKAATFIKSLNPTLPASPFPSASFPGPIAKGGCPLCDQSVYSYCSIKMIHDGCCCNAGNVPWRCPPVDCSYLNANSCFEHVLLFTCCCNNPYK